MNVAAEGFGNEHVAKELAAGETALDFALVRETTLTVRVVNKDNPTQPVPDASVVLTGTEWKAVTDAKGEAVFPKIPARPVKLDVTAKGFCDKQRQEKLAGGTAGLTVPLARGANLSVRVLYAADGKTPVAGANVRLVGSEQGRGPRAGGVSNPGAAAGQRDGGRGGPWTSGSHGPQGDSLRRHDPRRGLDRTAQVAGSVVNAIQNKPVPKATVRLTGPMPQQTETGADGRFQFTGVPTGSVEIEASAAKFSPERVTRQLVERGQSGIALLGSADRSDGAGRRCQDGAADRRGGGSRCRRRGAPENRRPRKRRFLGNQGGSGSRFGLGSGLLRGPRRRPRRPAPPRSASPWRGGSSSRARWSTPWTIDPWRAPRWSSTSMASRRRSPPRPTAPTRSAACPPAPRRSASRPISSTRRRSEGSCRRKVPRCFARS